MAQQQADFPVQFSVDYPDRPLDRFSSFFRIFFIIPIAIVIALVGQSGGYFGIWVSAGGFFFGAPLLMILFRLKYPRWWFNWNLEILRFTTRVSVYLFLLRDEYPSTDEEQAVHLDFPYPNVERDLNRWLPLVKWLLAIPHYIALFFFGIAAIIVVLIAWFAILFSGSYPRGLFNFVVGVIRWELAALTLSSA